MDVIAVTMVVAFVFMILGFPLWQTFLIVSLGALYFAGGVPLENAAVRLFSSLNVFALLAVPGFIFAGEVMTQAGMSQRLVNWIRALLGKVPGGMPLTAIAASEMFGATSGSSTATVVAVGKVLYPSLRASGHSERFSLGLLTSMGAIAVVIPPSIAMILYAVVTNASVGALFLAGFLPGIFVGVLVMIYSLWYAIRSGATKGQDAWSLRTVLVTTKDVSWTLLAPLIVFGGIYGGIFTPTEAAMVLSVYVVVVAILIHRSLNLPGLWRVSQDAMQLTAKIFLIVAAASVFSLLLVTQNVPRDLVQGVEDMDLSPVMILLAINIVLLIAGMFMDPNSAILVLTPLLWPLADGMGVDVIHFGIIVTMSVAIGMFTPPFGLNLFVATSVFRVSSATVIRSVMPFIAIYILALVVITYVPQLSLWLPSLQE